MVGVRVIDENIGDMEDRFFDGYLWVRYPCITVLRHNGEVKGKNMLVGSIRVNYNMVSGSASCRISWENVSIGGC